MREEWRAIDQVYVRDNPEAFFWTIFVDARYEGDHLPFLPASAIQARVELLQDIYQRNDERTQALYALEFEYFSGRHIDEFIAEATGRMEQIYRAIWLEGVDLDGLESATQLL